ncbi:hypothetical protein HRbin39_00124 [bacterium HR39]|nr:hypothetical protein HRbin39_00124 [bacterium HR39]
MGRVRRGLLLPLGREEARELLGLLEAVWQFEEELSPALSRVRRRLLRSLRRGRRGSRARAA